MQLPIILIGICIAWSAFSAIVPRYEMDVAIATRELKKSPKVEVSGKENVDVHPGQVIILNGEPVGFARPTKKFLLIKAWLEYRDFVYTGICMMSIMLNGSAVIVLGLYGLLIMSLIGHKKDVDNPNYYRVDNIFALAMLIPMLISWFFV